METPKHLPASESEEETLHLRDYWFVLMRHRGVVIATTLAAVFFTGIWVLVQKPVYRAVAVIEVRPERFDIGGSVFQPMVPFTVETFMNTQKEIAQSRTIAQMVLSRLGPDRAVTLLGRGAPQNGDARSEEALVQDLQRRIYVRARRQTFLMELGVEAPSPEASALLTNIWAESLIAFHRQREVEISQAAGEALTEQIQRLQHSIAEKEARLNRLAQTAQIQVLDQQINVAQQRLDNLNREILEAQNQLVEKLANLRRVQMSAPEGLPEIRGSPSIQNLQNACAKAEQEYAEKARIFKPDWPGLQQLAIQRDEACAQYRREVKALYQKVLQSAEAEVSAARDKERHLREQFESTRKEIDELNKAAAEYQTLKAEVENQRRLLDTMTQRRQQAQAAEVGGIQVNAILRVVERADPPKSRIRPRRLSSMALALMIGLMSGVGLAFLLHGLDTKIHSHEDIQRIVPYPFLTFIPELRGKEDEPFVQNAFRFLQGFVVMTRDSGPPVRSLLVTSPQPEEGKTFVAMNLAVMLAKTRKRVLLVEADTHRPQLHRIWSVPRRPGLLDLRGQEATVPWETFPQVNEFLRVIPAGVDRHVESKTERELTNLDMGRLVRRALESFDYVIFDTPPILSVPDTMRLVRDVDAVLLVVQCDRTTRPTLRMAAEQLEKVEARVLGTVLNRVDLSSKYSYYTYYYPYRYYYNYYLRSGKPGA